MRRRIIIHNHLPARRARDADDLQRYAGDTIWTDVSAAEFTRLRPGDTINVDGVAAEVIDKLLVPKKFGPVKEEHRVKVRFKARGGDSYFKKHPMAVSRDEEERHRDESYARTGITRVGRDEGEKKCSRCHGSGSIMMKGMSRPEQCPSCKGTGKTTAKDGGPGSGPKPGGKYRYGAEEKANIREYLAEKQDPLKAQRERIAKAEEYMRNQPHQTTKWK